MCDCLIPLAEVAKETRRSALKVRAEVEELGMTIRDDWAGHPAISESDARAFVSGTARRAQEHANAVSEHLRAVEEWAQRRDAAVKEGADKAQEKETRRAMRRGRLPGADGPLSPGEIAAARREGAMHAGAMYERRNPRPEFMGSRDYVKLAYVEPSEEGSLVAAAVGALRGAAKNKAPSVEVK
ncbi:hypothetical protein ABZ281_32545 [Streptomyces sp. NPDC006265]|uniref:hypothetical protein n=1 Tax=Streptomyces sp. NPDC006265 TaxID=3156740 RepID=UPI0033BA2C2C